MDRTERRLLAACGIVLVAVSALAAWGLPLAARYDEPFLTLENQVTERPWLAAGMALVALALFAGYGVGYLALDRVLQRKPGVLQRSLWGTLLVPPLLSAVLLLAVHPTTSLDLYDYLFRGTVALRYGTNNFVEPPYLFATDPLYAFVVWRGAVTAYGPLWELLSLGVAWLGAGRLLPLLLGYKLLAVLGWLLCALVIAAILGRDDRLRRPLGLYLWLWNPLALWEVAAAGHNDPWMLLGLLGALYATTRRPIPGLVSLTLGMLFKVPAAIFAPLVAAGFLGAARPRSLRNAGGRLAWLVAVGLLCAAIAAAAYAPWWDGLATFTNLKNRAELFTTSPLAVLHALASSRWPDAKEQVDRSLSLLGSCLLLGGVLAAAWRSWRWPTGLPQHCLWLLLWLLLLCNPWFLPWYVLWPLAALAVQPQRRRMVLAVGLLGLTAFLSYLASAWLLPRLGWEFGSVAWQGLLAALVYGPPLAVLIYGTRPRHALLSQEMRKI